MKLIKLYISLLTCTLFFSINNAQNGINYKAIVKNDLGNVVANQSIDVQFNILKGIAQTSVYQETHTPLSDENGIIIVNIGEGTTADDFSAIQWGDDTHFLNVQIDIGAGLVDMGTTEFKTVPYALYAESSGNSSTSTGLEALDEGTTSGWRLIGLNPDNYGDIGNQAVDLSQSYSISSLRGATGTLSFASGKEVIASGHESTAMGDTTTASGDVSTALGLETEASGSYSTAMGRLTISSGQGSTALGQQTIASNSYSTAMGWETISSGVASTALGRQTNADALYVTALGINNIGGGTSNLWVETDPIFEIGIGEVTPSNALTVLKNGTITAPSFDISEITDAKALITKEYLEANSSSASGLEAIDEGSGIGWRLIGKDPSFFGNININAVDLSTSDQNTNSKGATGQNAFAAGTNTLASGNRSTALGNFTTASAFAATALGSSSSATADGSVALGVDNTASGFGSIAMGGNTISDDEYGTAVGVYNDNTVSTTSLFQVGNGTFETRSNAFNIDKNGTITAPSFDIAEITDAKALITKEYADANYSGGGSGTAPTGLEAIDEGNGTGWRLIGIDSERYGNIGQNAVDLSLNPEILSTTRGATGSGSIATGHSTTASGQYSSAMGLQTTASGSYSTAFGFGTEASGISATATGSLTNASGLYSTALGRETLADALSATALGRETVASGLVSTAMGHSTEANSMYATAVGSNNIGGGSSNAWVETDPIFEIGNGQTTPSNALSVLKNGTITAPSFDISEITDNKALITKEYLEANSTSATGLEAINEGNGTGWRLVGRDPGYYGNIGENAVDLSTSTFVSTTGALGPFSTAMGGLTTASGSNSTAMGYRTIASGTDSFAAGSFATASGAGSIAMGSYVIADDGGSTVVGQYNDNTTTTTSLFQVGKGNSSVRSNALTILGNGKHIINSTDDGLAIENPGDDGLVITNAADYGAFITGENGVYLEADNDLNPDLILGGTSNTTTGDDGIIASDPLYSTSDILLHSNDNLAFHLDESGINDSWFRIYNDANDQLFEVNEVGRLGINSSGWGISVNADGYAAWLSGNSGVLITATDDTKPDLILSGTGIDGFEDDAVISSSISKLSSDLVLESFDDVDINLDKNNDEFSDFQINGSNGTLFEVDENGNATLDGSLTQNSDRRLKKDITAIDYGLKEILALQPKAYNWKNRETEKKSLGLIAQEVQPIISEIVNAQDDEQKTLGISYTELIPVLIKAIQEQQAIIDSQKQVITSQVQTNTKQTEVLQALLERVEALEKESSKSHIELAKN